MSEYEHYRGKLIKVEKIGNETLEKQCKRIIETIEQCTYAESDEYYTSYAEMITTEYYQQHIVHNEVLYQVEKQSINTDEDIFIAIPTDEGYAFEVKYYNGGCNFTEAIEYAFEDLEKEG